MSQLTVLAAGGVLWRGNPDDPEVALVHRPKYDDWSLPKGKAEAGEHLLVTALREMAEETGFRAHLGHFLTTTRYIVTSGGSSANKTVSYWSMRCGSGSFRPSDEVDAIEWLPVDEAYDRVDAKTDRTVLDVFRHTRKDTKLIALVRHGETLTRSHRTKGLAEEQQLNKTGLARATSLVPILEALGLTDLLSADQPACIDMLTPLAAATGLSVQCEVQLTRAAFAGNEMKVADHVRRRASSSDALVACAGKRVVSGLLRVLGESSDVALPARASFRRGDLWLVHHCDGLVSAYEKHELSA